MPTQLTRISLSRAICPGLDQEVSTSIRWNPVVDCLGLLLQGGRLEILWHRRGCRGGSRTRWIILAPPKTTRLLFFLGILGVWYSGQKGISAPMLSRGNWIRRKREHGNCDSSQMIATERRVCCCGVCWLPKCRSVACRLSKTLLCPSRGFASHPLVARCHSSRSVVLRI